MALSILKPFHTTNYFLNAVTNIFPFPSSLFSTESCRPLNRLIPCADYVIGIFHGNDTDQIFRKELVCSV